MEENAVDVEVAVVIAKTMHMYVAARDALI